MLATNPGGPLTGPTGQRRPTQAEINLEVRYSLRCTGTADDFRVRPARQAVSERTDAGWSVNPVASGNSHRPVMKILNGRRQLVVGAAPDRLNTDPEGSCTVCGGWPVTVQLPVDSGGAAG
jgi:hypothetical protein